jgi:ribonuclease-3
VDALDAILAAIYLDGGLEAARAFVLREIVAPEIKRMEQGGGVLPVTDFKSALQEAAQGLGLPQPMYVLVQEAGPEHSKTFTVEARLNMKDNKGQANFVGRAQGSTKKTAEQDAARQLLGYLAARSKEAATVVASATPAGEK